MRAPTSAAAPRSLPRPLPRRGRTPLVAAALTGLVAGLLAGAAPAGLTEDEDRERARDYGATLRIADAARAAGDYRDAENALQGYLQRWRDRGIGVRELDAVHNELERLVKLRELLELAATDNAAARRYLAAVVTHHEPSARAQEQARALAILARHNAAIGALFSRTFPAAVVVQVDAPMGMPPEPMAIEFRNALLDITRNQELPLWGGGGVGTMEVRAVVRENDRKNSILEGTAMKSWAVHAVVDLKDAEGKRVVQTALTTAMLGINPGNASLWAQSRIADRLYTAMLDQLAREIDSGALP